MTLKYMFVPDGVEKKQTTLAHVNKRSRTHDDKVPYFRSAHERMRNAGSDTQQGRRKTRLKTSQKLLDLDTRVLTSRQCGETRTFSATIFTVSSKFTFGDNQFILLMFFGFG